MIQARKLLWIFWFPILLIWGTSCTPTPQEKEPLAWEPQAKLVEAHLRGLSVVSDSVVWASGTNGTWLCTENGGDSWVAGTVPDADTLDFRDIHAVDKRIAWVISAGSPAVIFQTTDQGKNWTEQYRNSAPEIFMDGFDFENEQIAIAYGDPIDGDWQLLKTQNGGQNWISLETEFEDSVSEGEAGFAASGTGVQMMESRVWMASGGGPTARMFRSEDAGISWKAFDTPLRSAEGCGIFSFAFEDKLNGIAVGGCYLDSTATEGNCAISTDGGSTWAEITEKPPLGYRSCVAYAPGRKVAIAVGRSGSDVSTDGGATWTSIGTEGYYVCGFSDRMGWAVGKSGKMARMKLD